MLSDPLKYQGPKSADHLDPNEDGRRSKRKIDKTIPYDLPDSQKNHRRADIALKWYNKKNGASYELLQVILSNGFLLDGFWFHCNFTARQLVDGESSYRIFFAEMVGDINSYNRPMMETYTLTECILLEGITTLGCSFCPLVLHPSDGFRHGLVHHKSEYSPTLLPAPYQSSAPYPLSRTPNSLNPHTYTLKRKLDTLDSKIKLELRASSSPASSSYHSPALGPCINDWVPEKVRYAMIALDHYNKENGTEYELVDALDINGALLSGIWYHCNFTAKLPNSDIAPKFFTEINPSAERVDVTACQILEGKTEYGCRICVGNEIEHPFDGYKVGMELTLEALQEP